MQITPLNTIELNTSLKEKGYKGWSFEYDSSLNRYCLSIFDNHNPEDELVFFLHAFDLNISHAIRYKKNGIENAIDRRHPFYLKAEEIISSFLN
ncbi:hypothetical protein AAGG74_18820 [Bacillus mexicanus]|uniref:hypothetical protein n=1 Tax=Bacillus mexicanus TaxID=2834415 RepID=UPI003D1CEEE9